MMIKLALKPEVLRQKPKHVVQWVRDNQRLWPHIAITAALENGIRTHRTHFLAKTQEEETGVKAVMRSRYGALWAFCEDRQEQAMRAAGSFDMHSVFCLTDKPEIDEANHRVVLAFSTKNLLRNAARQQLAGAHSQCQNALMLRSLIP